MGVVKWQLCCAGSSLRGLKMILSLFIPFLLCGGVPPILSRAQLDSPESSQPIRNISFNEDLGLQIDPNDQEVNINNSNRSYVDNLGAAWIPPARDCAPGFWFNQLKNKGRGRC